MANREMFKRILGQIESEPMSFEMGGWQHNLAGEAEEGGDFEHHFYDPSTDGASSAMASECGTTRCIAGWGIHFAAEDLGLDVARPLAVVALEVADKMGIRVGRHGNRTYDYEALGKAVLDIEDNIFYLDDRDGYMAVRDYANGVRS